MAATAFGQASRSAALRCSSMMNDPLARSPRALSASALALLLLLLLLHGCWRAFDTKDSRGRRPDLTFRVSMITEYKH